MNTPCSIALLESALAGSLPAEDEAVLHRHLEECEACGAALERMAGGPAWCQEAAALLTEDELDTALPGRGDWSDVDFTVDHLEFADQPGVLGRLGGYDVLEIIGRGGMGVVLKGYDRELKRCVAIKVLSPHLAQSSLARKRFAREAQAAAAVVHPNVLAIHQVQPSGRLPFLVMPLVAGESLAARLTAQGRLELKEILRIGMQAAAGLAAAHEQGLVHRDVKPANILLEKGVERAVLTDFGLARAADDVTLTRWGVIAGTPQYMSPEQARGEPLDGRSDLFSLGCVLYEMATGVSPFRSDSVMATMRRLVDDSPQAMASLNPELPPWFIAIVDRLLEKDRSQRFNTAKEVSELLEGCLAHVQQPAGVPLPAALSRPEQACTVPAGIGIVARQCPNFASLFRPPRGVAIMFSLLGISLLAAAAVLTTPPDISGTWSGEDWGQVVLKKVNSTEYTGTYSDTVGKQPGEIQLKWSRIERRFNGIWREGEDRFGELSLRRVGDEIRGALTTDANSKINPATPRLADLTWTRTQDQKLSFGPATNGLQLEQERTVVAEIRVIEVPDALPLDLTKLDLSTIERMAGVSTLAAPRIVARSGQDCEINVGGEGNNTFSPTPSGVTVRLLPTLDGNTVHYKAKLSTRARQKPHAGERTTIRELAYAGDAQLDRPVMVDIGKGEKDHRFLAWMVFHREENRLTAEGGSTQATFGPAIERVVIKNFAATAKLITKDGITVDQNAWRIEAKGDRTVRLFEVPGPGVEECRVIYQAKLKTENLQGRAYLEMWCRLSSGEFFSKGLQSPVTGSTDWASYETPFFLKKGERPDLIKLNLVVEGKGTLWIKDVELSKAPLEAAAGLEATSRFAPLQPGHVREASEAGSDRGSLLAGLRSATANLIGVDGPREVTSGTIRREVGRQLKEAGASFDDLTVPVAEDRNDGTPFAVHYRGLRNFKAADGTTFQNANGEFIMAYIGGGRWQGSLAGTCFTVSVGKVDNIDLPFVNDLEVVGAWKSIDFVASPSDFKPDKQNWKGDLSMKGLSFLPGGKTPWPWCTWTKGVLIHHGDKTASHYEVKEIQGQRFMFIEWKSGDVMILGHKPMYYVLRWCMSVNKAEDSAVSTFGPAIERVTVDGNKVVIEGRAPADTRIAFYAGERNNGWSCGFPKAARFSATLEIASQGLVCRVVPESGDPILTLDGVKQIGTAQLSEGQLVFRAGQPHVEHDGTCSVNIGEWTAKSGEISAVGVSLSPPRPRAVGKVPVEVEKAVKTISTCAEGDPRVVEALGALKRLNEADVVTHLAKFLDSKEATIRRAAVYMLWQGKFASIAPAVPGLLRLCEHEEDLTRGMAALALGGKHVASSLAVLMKMTSDDRSGYARRCAAIALGFLGDPAATSVLEKVLKDPELMVRANAQAALKMLGGKAAEKEDSGSTHRGVLEEACRQARAVASRQEAAFKAGHLDAMDFEVAKGKVEILEAELTGDPVQIARANLLAARRQLQLASHRFEAGILDAMDFEVAKGKVEVFEAELTGDPVQVASVNLVAARRQLQLASNRFKVGMLTASDFEKVKANVAIAEAKVQDAEAKRLQSVKSSVEIADHTLSEQPPVVVETVPASGTRDVTPGMMEIRVRFSKPMADGSWSWSTAWENSTPEFIGPPHYEADGRTCVVKVKLEPGQTYAFWLNSENFHNFKDRDGRAAVPYLLIFQTKPKQEEKNKP